MTRDTHRNLVIAGIVLSMILLLIIPVAHAEVLEYEPGKLIIKLKKSPVKALSVRDTGYASLDALLSAYNAYEIEPVFDMTKGNIARKKELGMDRFYAVTLPKSTDLTKARETFGSDASIEKVNLNNRVELVSTEPDDDYYGRQWGLDIIEAPEAWDYTTGHKSTVVAIIDTGIDTDHSDLHWEDGKDYDDGGKPEDGCGHGTHVAGIIGARTNNDRGIAGICWNCNLVILKCFDENGSGYDDCTYKAVEDAVDDYGSDIINMSFVSGSWDPMEAACAYAYGEDVTLIAGTGNIDDDAPKYPAGYETVIAVGASDSRDNRWIEEGRGSNYGDHLDLVAPGVDIYSTWLSNDYHYDTGTSMATPHVTGVVALMHSLHPEYTPEQFREALKDSADYIAGGEYEVGAGRLNAYEALKSLPQVRISASPSSYDFGEIPVSQASTPAVFTVTNAGYGILMIKDIFVDGLGQDCFQINNDTCSSLDYGLGRNESCTLEITFTPSQERFYYPRLKISSFDHENPIEEIELNGYGVPIPLVQVSPESLDFGTVFTYHESLPQAISITNIGTADLLIEELLVDGQDPTHFIIPGSNDRCSGQTVEPGQNCAFEVVFAPREEGEKTAGIVISSNGWQAPHTVPVSGSAETLSYQLTVEKTGGGIGTVESFSFDWPPAISCGTDCTEILDEGTALRLMASPDIGSSFTGWSGGGCSGIGDCYLSIQGNTTVTAAFEPTSHTTYSGETGYAEIDGVSPDSGSTSDTFIFKVVYRNEMGYAPLYVSLHIDGDTAGVDMIKDNSADDPALRDGNYTNGEQYYYQISGLSEGCHQYFFTVVDEAYISKEKSPTFNGPFVHAPDSPPPMEIGTVRIDSNWKTVPYQDEFCNPVVIAKGLSKFGGDPAVVRMNNVTTRGFDIRVQEWDNGDHVLETVSYLVTESGRFMLGNGLEMEAGKIGTDKADVRGPFCPLEFSTPFETVPVIATTVMTENGNQAVTTRNRAVSQSGLETVLQEKEGNENATHAFESIGYIAWEEGSGMIGTINYDVGSAGFIDHLWNTFYYGPLVAGTPELIVDMQTTEELDTASLGLRSKSSDSAEVTVCEETSKDTETDHFNAESVGFLSFSETPPPLVFEAGEVTAYDYWTRVTLASSYSNPIVLAKPLGNNQKAAAVVAIRNVDATGFDIKIKEWPFQDGDHDPETIDYLVAEEGRYVLSDGTEVEIGKVVTSKADVNAPFYSVPFLADFKELPILATSIMTTEGASTVTTRNKNVGPDRFKVILQEQELNDPIHCEETIGFIAWEPGSGQIGGVRYEVDFAGPVTGEWATISYGPFLQPPLAVFDMQTANEADTAALRYNSKTENSIQLYVQEEKSKDTETGHEAETVGYITLEGLP